MGLLSIVLFCDHSCFFCRLISSSPAWAFLVFVIILLTLHILIFYDVKCVDKSDAILPHLTAAQNIWRHRFKIVIEIKPKIVLQIKLTKNKVINKTKLGAKVIHKRCSLSWYVYSLWLCLHHNNYPHWEDKALCMYVWAKYKIWTALLQWLILYNGILQIPPQMVSMTATINWQKQDGQRMRKYSDLRMMMETVMMLICWWRTLLEVEKMYNSASTNNP